MRRIHLLLLPILALVAVACEGDNGTSTDNKALLFDIEIEATTDTSVTFDITPSDPSADYFYYVVDFATANGFSRDSYLVSNILQMVEEGATAEGKSFVEYMSTAVCRGATEGATFSGLEPGGEYYVVAFGLDAASGYRRATSELQKVPFRCAIYSSALSFEIEVWDIEQLSVCFSITPSNDKDQYCALVQPWDGVSTAEEVMHQIVDQWGGWMSSMANDRGRVEHSGATKFELPAADMLYSIIAFGYDGGITSEPTMATFRTLKGGNVEDAVFTMRSSRVTPYDCSLGVTSSDPTIFYIPGVYPKDEYNEAEVIALEKDIFNYYLTEYRKFNPSITYAELLDQYYYKDSCNFTVSGLMPDTDYMGYVYIFDPATGDIVRSITFDNVAHTATVGPVLASMSLVGYYSGDEEAGTIFGLPAATAGRAIVVVEFGNIEDVRTLYTIFAEGDYSDAETYPDTEFWRLSNGAWNTCPLAKPYLVFDATWDATYTVACYAVDKQGATGALSRLKVCPTAANVSPIEELRELWQ